MPIETSKELENNIRTFDTARTSADQNIRQLHAGFVERGRAFIPYTSKDGICFIPSRFAGSLNSQIENYENDADGGETNRIISSILGIELVSSDGTEEHFRQFCKRIGAKISNYQRRYWNINDIFEDTNGLFPQEYLARKSTETAAIRKARIGQGEFRDKLIKFWGGRCAITTCNVTSLLKASHIKPWRDCSDEERLDVFNGLLLVPNLDSLFDSGFITFNNEGNIQISNRLAKEQFEFLGLSENTTVKLSAEHQDYLQYHRKNIFY